MYECGSASANISTDVGMHARALCRVIAYGRKHAQTWNSFAMGSKKECIQSLN